MRHKGQLLITLILVLMLGGSVLIRSGNWVQNLIRGQDSRIFNPLFSSQNDLPRWLLPYAMCTCSGESS